MTTFLLGMHGLPAGDERLIRYLMRMFGHDPQFNWRLAEGPQCDALITDAQVVTPSKLERNARMVLRLCSESKAPIGAGDMLARPIHPVALRNWLSDTETTLLQSTRQASTQSPSALPRSVPIDSAYPLSPVSSVRFKLRGWPPTIMLTGSPQRQHMAQLLSTDAFDAHELASLTGAPVAECQSFLRKLQLVGLVDLVQNTPAPAGGPATLPMDEPDENLVTTKGERTGFSATLLRLRDRLKR